MSNLIAKINRPVLILLSIFAGICYGGYRVYGFTKVMTNSSLWAAGSVIGYILVIIIILVVAFIIFTDYVANDELDEHDPY